MDSLRGFRTAPWYLCMMAKRGSKKKAPIPEPDEPEDWQANLKRAKKTQGNAIKPATLSDHHRVKRKLVEFIKENNWDTLLDTKGEPVTPLEITTGTIVSEHDVCMSFAGWYRNQCKVRQPKRKASGGEPASKKRKTTEEGEEVEDTPETATTSKEPLKKLRAGLVHLYNEQAVICVVILFRVIRCLIYIIL